MTDRIPYRVIHRDGAWRLVRTDTDQTVYIHNGDAWVRYES